MSVLPPLPQQNVVEFISESMTPTWRQFWQNLLIYIQSVSTDLAAAIADIGLLQVAVTALQGAMTTAQANITTLQGKVTTLETYASNHPYTFATLPAAGTVGRLAYITDGPGGALWGSNAAGGGAVKYLLWDNGTNWTVVGK
jgi:hypothetical protein